MEETLFSWVHLSDIHIGHGDEEHRWDQKLVLAKLREDLPKVIALGAPRPDAILVTGDIAFSGAGRTRTEYAEAKEWLLSVGAAVGLTHRRTFVVPGNHDVDRASDKSRQVARLLDHLRSGRTTPDASIDEALKDVADRTLIASRMKAYLAFAAEFAPFCDRNPPAEPEARLFWRETLSARGGLRVRLVGLNTALLAADDADEGKLQLGKQQLDLALRPELAPGELGVVLSHHPLSRWLSDGTDADRWIQSGAHLHLFGHVHEPEFESARRGAGTRFLRVTAGAAHADKQSRGVPASHGYNFAAVVRGAVGEAILRVWPRRWTDRHKVFRADPDLLDDSQVFVDNKLSLALPARLPSSGPPSATQNRGPAVAAPADKSSAAAMAFPGTPSTVSPVEVFYFYSPDDEQLCKRLETHLALLVKMGVISAYSSRSVGAGALAQDSIDARIESARVFLALLSASFIASRYFDGPEMTRALDRAARREALMIPIYLKPFDREDNPVWSRSPLSTFQGLPRDGKPVSLDDLDSALAGITRELREAVQNLI